ncbi:MAG TPA: hypothetical protein VN429_08260 [Methanospirillum sp.]|uniref:hypothetical protein n=1 Tax=Methanospirillum sp. TaxID=45200 RepID=UPI002D057FCF|nr:hypothetical protein [Methanospirillum sp.]HWQ64396.1 hypothetical protein [Methanospirillum sp.]
MSIEEKFERLNPAAQNAAEAFIDFLLSREERGFSSDEEMSEEFGSIESDPAMNQTESNEFQSSGTDNSGIILAEERMIEEESVIDFADINTRFAPKDPKKGAKDKAGPVRQKKMFDWL